MGKKIKRSKKIAVIVSEFNKEITEGLLKGALKAFDEKNINESSVNVIRCPGAFEIPYIARKLCVSKKYSAVVCLGAVIKGETAHFEYISDAVSKSIAGLNLQSDIPVIFGVLTCYTYEQAAARSQDNRENKGAEAALAALDMISLKI